MDTHLIRAALAQLHYNWEQFSIPHFIQHVAQQRQRPIAVEGVPFATREYSGLCVITPRGDHLFFDTNRHHIIQEHTQLHELAHLVLNHAHLPLHLNDIRELVTLLHLRSERCQSGSHEETEAERFAFLVQRTAFAAQRIVETRATDQSPDTHIPPFTEA